MEGNVALNQLVPQRILWDVDPTALNIDQSTASTVKFVFSGTMASLVLFRVHGSHILS